MVPVVSAHFRSHTYLPAPSIACVARALPHRLPKSVGAEGDFRHFGHRSSMLMVEFDWQGVKIYISVK